MNSSFVTLVILLGMVPVAASISCYYCGGCPANSALSSNGVTSYTACGTYYLNGLWYRGGDDTSSSCSVLITSYTALGATNTKCCTTDLCNRAETTGVSLFLAVGIAILCIVGFL